MTAFLNDHSNKNFTAQTRENTAYIALTAFQEIFLAYNMFFILDEDKLPDIIRDEGRQITYKMLSIIKKPRLSNSISDIDTEMSESSEEGVD